MAAIEPFQIAIPQDKIDRLKQKLALTDLPDEIEDDEPWNRGPPLADIKRLAKYWAESYDWRKAEATLNEIPQYTTPVDVDGFGSLNVHFLHEKSECSNAIPLLFIHGWPGCFLEAVKILPKLTQGGDEFPAFHVVAPSMVNFGFSDGTKRKDWQLEQHGEVCKKLMDALGYQQYVVQGGDFGYFVARYMALTYPASVKAQHFNMIVPPVPKIGFDPSTASSYEQGGLMRGQETQKSGMGYFHIQATKPQTIGYSVTDSPVGLLAWIYDKMHDWTDSYKWTEDEILTWVSIYYFSKAGPAASQRLYYETHHRSKDGFSSGPGDGLPPSWLELQAHCNVPLGVSRFPKELAMFPRAWHDAMGPVVFWKDNDRGGHFAAWEVPDLVVNDLRAMFAKKGGAYGVVSGKDGYS